MLGDLPMGGFRITGLGAGTAAGDAVTKAQLDAIVTALTQPTGQISAFARSTAPSGWVKANGGTIGNASSGASTRANADTETLFSLLWSQFSNTILPIQTSGGVASTRGASAAADYAANKRLAIPEFRGEFIRGWSDGRAVDTSRVLGSSQLDEIKGHTHSVTGTADPGGDHNHGPGGSVSAFIGAQAGGSFSIGTAGGTGQVSTTDNSGPHGHSVTGTAAAGSGAETRPRNIAMLICIKL